MQYKDTSISPHTPPPPNHTHTHTSYSDLCTPVGEMVRMTRLHSGLWEKEAEGMKKVRSDYENMQRRLNIATRRIEMMSAEVSSKLSE